MCTVQDVGYLALEDVLVSPACKAADDDGASELPEEDPLEDTAALSAAACVPTHVYSYHLAYHPSYGVPILLFSGRLAGGLCHCIPACPLPCTATCQRWRTCSMLSILGLQPLSCHCLAIITVSRRDAGDLGGDD